MPALNSNDSTLQLSTVEALAVSFQAAAYFQLAPALAAGISLTMLALPTLALGPSLQSWQLTGQHRIINIHPKTQARVRAAPRTGG